MRDEAGRVLLHQAVQRGLLGSVALVVHRARSGRAALWLARPRGGVHGKDMAQGGVCTGEARLWLAEQSAYDVWQAAQRFKAAPMRVQHAPSSA